jgi:hypothetical protein
VPHRKGSFHEDWNDLLTRFAHRRKHDEPRQEMLEKARHEAEKSHLNERDPHQALFERANAD